MKRVSLDAEEDRMPSGKAVNLLDLVPERAIDWETSEDGKVSLLKPRLRHPWLAKHILPRLKKPYYRIKLDSVGSFLWEACNGKRSAEEMGRMLKARFGDKVEPLYERLALFLQGLEKHGFIRYKD